jgi:hypothetical protein
MNPNPPINQALIGIFQGNAAEIATRLTAFTAFRANLRKCGTSPLMLGTWNFQHMKLK